MIELRFWTKGPSERRQNCSVFWRFAMRQSPLIHTPVSVSVQDVLADAGVQDGAQYLYITSGDGFYETVPLDLINSDRRMQPQCGPERPTSCPAVVSQDADWRGAD
jgi:hypothetical protein